MEYEFLFYNIEIYRFCEKKKNYAHYSELYNRSLKLKVDAQT